MDGWLNDVKLLLPLLGLVAHAGITWWKVDSHERRHERAETEIDSLREWRAQAREQIAQLQRDGHEE